jgi:hypothetical protein
VGVNEHGRALLPYFETSIGAQLHTTAAPTFTLCNMIVHKFGMKRKFLTVLLQVFQYNSFMWRSFAFGFQVVIVGLLYGLFKDAVNW